MIAWKPDDHPRIPTRIEVIENSVERQERQLEDVIKWTRRTTYTGVVMAMSALGAVAILLLEKIL